MRAKLGSPHDPDLQQRLEQFLGRKLYSEYEEGQGKGGDTVQRGGGVSQGSSDADRSHSAHTAEVSQHQSNDTSEGWADLDLNDDIMRESNATGATHQQQPGQSTDGDNNNNKYRSVPTMSSQWLSDTGVSNQSMTGIGTINGGNLGPV